LFRRPAFADTFLTPLEIAAGVAAEHQLRPQLPNRWPPELRLLLQRCWHRSPSARPEFEEIARVLAERNALEVDPESEVTVTSGCTEAIFAAIAGSCDPGDEVILFQPFYDSYLASVRMAGGWGSVRLRGGLVGPRRELGRLVRPEVTRPDPPRAPRRVTRDGPVGAGGW
jgi:hypothetical protein